MLAARGSPTGSAASTTKTPWTGAKWQRDGLQVDGLWPRASALGLSGPKGWPSLVVYADWDMWGTFGCIPAPCWHKPLLAVIIQTLTSF